MEKLIAQVKHDAGNGDEAARKKLLQSLRDLAFSIESPEDTIQRVMFEHLKIAMVRVGIDLKLFGILAESSEPLTVEQLAQKTGAAPVLLSRILRYLASVGDIYETSKDTFAATNITKTLANPGVQAGIHHYFDNMGPAYQAIPDFLKENQYADVTDVTNAPLQKAWNTPLPAFLWVQTKPEGFAYFNQWMAAQRDFMPTWLDVYPVEEESKNISLGAPLFVDVGGGLGHQCIALVKKYPQLPGRVILQDIPATLEHAIKHDKVEIVVQDFFQPQAIKGAKFYYLRNILHDYPEDKCHAIIKNTIDAMGPESVILIDDMVLPNTGVHWQATQLDMQMLASLASMERTKEQWYALLESAGLRIVKILTYTLSLQDSIIVAVPK